MTTPPPPNSDMQANSLLPCPPRTTFDPTPSSPQTQLRFRFNRPPPPAQPPDAAGSRLEFDNALLAVARAGPSPRPAYLPALIDPWFPTVERDAYAEFLLERPADGLVGAAAVAANARAALLPPPTAAAACQVLLAVTTSGL